MFSFSTLPFGWSANKLSLIAGNIFAGIVLIVLSHTAVFPLDLVNFIFFSSVGFLFALYRPGWMFLLLIGMVPYEIITIAPESFPLALRPYQWLLVLVSLALLVRLVLRRFPVERFVPAFWDYLWIIIGASSFVAAAFGPAPALALKQSLVLVSFVLLYFIVRIFVRSIDDARMLLPFIFSSFLIIALYALVQNILFLNGQESFAVMSGRPNATFSEADWLGGYLAFVLVALAALIAAPLTEASAASARVMRFIFSALLFIGGMALIITVSRSAWLAACIGIFAVLACSALQRGVIGALLERDKDILKGILSVKLFVLAPFAAALFAVSMFGLTPFDLSDRGISVTSGNQKITVACTTAVALPDMIASLETLAGYGCEHIRLEDIPLKQAAGLYVTEVFRDDPNIGIRRNIYAEVTRILKERFLSGIGFGAVANALGTDERGAGLNASNIFLEVWLGAGIIGFLAFLVFWFGLGWRWLSLCIRKKSSLALALSSLWIGVTVFNLFNSGLFLAWFFMFLAFLLIRLPETSYE